MILTQELTEKIEARISEIVTDTSPKNAELRQIVAKLKILPLLMDWAGGFAIRPDGEIVSFSFDSPYDVEIENNLRHRNSALFQGSKKYPELKELVPSRSSDAIECPHCNGTGIERYVAEHGLNPEVILCYCGGLGWLPKDEE